MLEIEVIDTGLFSAADCAQLRCELSPAQRRANLRYRQERDRRNHLLGRLLIKRRFARDRSFSWDQWQTRPNGKPEMSGHPRFNLSHSRQMVAAAFSDRPVGLDLEWVDADFPMDDLRSFFHPEEQAFIASAADSARAFYQCWTRKEAYFKAVGTGLSARMHQINCLQDALPGSPDWQLQSLAGPAEYALAVCSPYSAAPIVRFLDRESIQTQGD
ncbi:MAG: 4'-phosphopantetheinyl transferase superfamily protein [Bacteroidota bacterium]